MISKKLIHWSHLALILGGLYEIIAPFLFQSKGFIGWGLIILGLCGIHARQARKVGWLGHLGFGIILFSSILPIALGISERANSPKLNLASIAVGGFQLMGILLYAIATLRASILPKSIGYLLLVSIVTIVVAGVGLSFWGIPIGCILWIKKNIDAPLTSSVQSQEAGY